MLLVVLLSLPGLACVDDPPDDPPQQVAASLVELTGLDHESIVINPAEIVSLRSPRRHNRLLPPGANCAVQMSAGHHISVIETCKQVRLLIDAPDQVRGR